MTALWATTLFFIATHFACLTAVVEAWGGTPYSVTGEDCDVISGKRVDVDKIYYSSWAQTDYVPLASSTLKWWDRPRDAGRPIEFVQCMQKHVPASFNADVHLITPEKSCIGTPMTQGLCGSCYAFAIAGSFSDQVCRLRGKGSYVTLSPQNLISCQGYTDSSKKVGSRKNPCDGANLYSNVWGQLDVTPLFSCTGANCNDGCQPYVDGTSDGSVIDTDAETCQNINGSTIHIKDGDSGVWTNPVPTDGNAHSGKCGSAHPQSFGTCIAPEDPKGFGQFDDSKHGDHAGGSGSPQSWNDVITQPSVPKRCRASPLIVQSVGGRYARSDDSTSGKWSERISSKVWSSTVSGSDPCSFSEACGLRGSTTCGTGKWSKDSCCSAVERWYGSCVCTGEKECQNLDGRLYIKGTAALLQRLIHKHGSFPVVISVRAHEWETFWSGNWGRDTSTRILRAEETQVIDDMGDHVEGVDAHFGYRDMGGKCGTNHAVRAVGWGTDGKTPYWVLANSWGKSWGDNGFFRVERGKNVLCLEGITSWMVDSMVPILAKENIIERPSRRVLGKSSSKRQAAGSGGRRRRLRRSNSSATISGDLRVGHRVNMPLADLMKPEHPHHPIVDAAIHGPTFHKHIPEDAAFNLSRTQLHYDKNHVQGSSQRSNTCRLHRGTVQVVAGLRYRVVLNCTVKIVGENISHHRQFEVDGVLEPFRRSANNGTLVPSGPAVLKIKRLLPVQDDVAAKPTGMPAWQIGAIAGGAGAFVVLAVAAAIIVRARRQAGMIKKKRPDSFSDAVVTPHELRFPKGMSSTN